MFFIGDTTAAAAHYWAAAKKGNPIVPDIHYEEMSELQLRKTLTYCRMAYNKAVEDGCYGEALEPLAAPYKEVFGLLYAVSPEFRLWVTDKGRSFHPVDFLEEFSED